MNEHDAEAERLDEIGADGWYARGANAEMIEYCADLFARFFHGTSCMELGPAHGLLTTRLVEHFDHVTVVDGSVAFCELLRERFPTISVHHSLFETFESERRFDTLVLGHVLEHVDDPVALLRTARSWMADGAVLLAAVPNANSLHRELAVELGMLATRDELNATDLHHGHRRVYDPNRLRADFEDAGYIIEHQGGYWLKTLSNAQIESWYSPELLRACMVVGERHPDIAAETYVVAR